MLLLTAIRIKNEIFKTPWKLINFSLSLFFKQFLASFSDLKQIAQYILKRIVAGNLQCIVCEQARTRFASQGYRFASPKSTIYYVAWIFSRTTLPPPAAEIPTLLDLLAMRQGWFFSDKLEIHSSDSNLGDVLATKIESPWPDRCSYFVLNRIAWVSFLPFPWSGSFFFPLQEKGRRETLGLARLFRPYN